MLARLFQKRNLLKDQLTGLPNKTALEKKIDSLISNNEPFILIYIDIDNFSRINNALGYETGNDILKIIGGRISALLPNKQPIYRIGGDKFATIVLGHPRKEVAKISEHIRDALSDSIALQSHSVHIRASVGASQFPTDSNERWKIMRMANVAVDWSGEHKHNAIEFYQKNFENFAEHAVKREFDLKQALDNKEFTVLYQPIIHTMDKSIKGFEALARWNHPQEGLLSPSEFIEVAEISGFIERLDNQILETVCRDISKWQKNNLPKFSIAVNVSPVQFVNHNLTKNIDRITEEFSIKPSMLEIEITESVAMKNVKRTFGILKELADKGMRITIDDFGTGYSSLAYLKYFPISSLKIDKSFVRGAMSNKSDADIIRAIILMAKALSLKVTAEGIETAEQYKLLSDLGCDFIQGYLVSKPLPAEQVPSWINDFNKKDS